MKIEVDIDTVMTEDFGVPDLVHVAAEPLVTSPGPRRVVPSFEHDDRYAHMWFTTVRHPWSSLVLVPSDDDDSAFEVARRLADIGRVHHHGTVEVVDASSLGAKDLVQLLPQIEARSRKGGRVLIAVPSPLTHHSAIPIARAADAALLLVRIGQTSFTRARQTMECVGAASFIGSLTLKR